MQRFNRARLITFDDPAYQQHVTQMQLQRANNRAIRPPSQRDLFGGEVEQIVREVLGARWPLSDRRILEYEERRGRGVQRKYRELDVVAIDGHTRIHVVEVKASRRAGALHRALRQLGDTAEILRLLFRQVSTSIVLVDTGIITPDEQAEIANSEDAPERLPQTLDEAIAEHPDLQRVAGLGAMQPFENAIQLAVLNVDDVIALAGDRVLSLDWEADEGEDEPVPDPSPAAPLYSTPDDADESPFATALRNAKPRR
jgi:hypothetical protein